MDGTEPAPPEAAVDAVSDTEQLLQGWRESV